MIKRTSNIILISFLMTLTALSSSACASDVKLGVFTIPIPKDWKKIEGSEEPNRVTLVSQNNDQQATISHMRFDSISFEDFKLICKHRLDAEREDNSNIKMTVDEPFQDGERFGMFYSGQEGSRLFSGYFSAHKNELLTVYIESIGVESQKHFKTFKGVVETIRYHDNK